MSKALSLSIAAVCAAGMLVVPASAGGKKIHESFMAQACPLYTNPTARPTPRPRILWSAGKTLHQNPVDDLWKDPDE